MKSRKGLKRAAILCFWGIGALVGLFSCIFFEAGADVGAFGALALYNFHIVSDHDKEAP